MATSLTATPLPEQAAVRLRLESTAAAYTPVVMNDFSGSAASRDQELARWTSSDLVNMSVYGITLGGLYVITLDSSNPAAFATRAVAALVVGQRYRLSLAGNPGSAPWSIGISGIGSKTVRSLALDSGLTNGGLVYEFVATATTHQIQISLAQTPESGRAFFDMSALRLEPISGALVKLETDFPSTEYTNWSVAGTPAGAASTQVAVAATSGERTFGRRWDWTSGAPNLNGASLRRTITGLTVGKQYTVRLAAYNRAYINGVTTAFQMTAGIVGMTASAAATWPSWRWITYTFTATATSHVLAMTVAQAVTLDAAGEYAQFEMSYVRVDEASASTWTATLASLTRSDANGTTSVRLFQGQNLSGGLLIHTDYEAALTGLVTYTAVVNTGAGQETATAQFTGLAEDQNVILAPATMPQYLQEVFLVTGYEGQRVAQTTIHDVIGRPDPLVTLGVLGMRRGTLDIWCDSYAQGHARQAVYEQGEVVLLRQPFEPGLDMYHVAQSTSLSKDETRWKLSISYVETAAPTGPLLGSLGWTFDQAAALYSTFAAARTIFPTFNDYTLGPVS